mmetsp:Transcript_91096/g.262666  ORF Transcript_91096/g.262666 Transcript_91096/m.262666 type:complete len:273 (+) Transcript_91096:581-1399(+)
MQGAIIHGLVLHARVQPIHVAGVVRPNGQGKDHAPVHSISHLGNATDIREDIGLVKQLLLLFDGVIDDRLVEFLHHLAIFDLLVYLHNLAQDAGFVGNELRPDCDRLLQINQLKESLLRAPPAEEVDIGSIRITWVYAICGAGVACGLFQSGTRVGSHRDSHAVALEEVHLRTTRHHAAILVEPRVLHEDQVLRTLRIAVADATLPAAIVRVPAGECGPLVAHGIHRDQIDRRVHAGGHFRQIQGEGDLGVDELEHVVAITAFFVHICQEEA